MEPFTNAPIKTDTPRFTHLKVYSCYSVGVGLNTPAEICAHAGRVGYSSVAVTDIEGTYGFIEFHLAAKKAGVKPVYGTVVHHFPVGRPGNERFVVTLLALTREGLRHIAALSSLSTAATELGTALDIDVLSAHATDVVAFMGGADSEIARLLLEGDEENAGRVVGVLKEVFGGRLFVEVQDHGVSDERVLASKLLSLAGETKTAPLLTQEVRYAEKGMRDLYGTLRGIRHPAEERDFFRIDRHSADWSMKSPLEMSQLRPFYGAAYDNTIRVDEMVPGDLLDDIEKEAADEGLPGGGATREGIVERCARAFEERYGRFSEAEILRRRSILEGEVEEAVSEGCGPTLLFFHRVLSRLREEGVEIGPATGLSLQSLCANLLGITCFDPYHYNERFRPRFDSRTREAGEFELQLTAETRAEAVHALFTLFGFGEVAYLPAIERVTPAKAIRMVASVVDVPGTELDDVSAIVARHPGVSIEKLYEQDGRLGRLYRHSLAVRDLLTRAALFEDLPIGIVKSRRSLALSPVPLTDFLGHSIDSDTGDLFVQSGRDNFPVAHIFRLDITSLGALSAAVRVDEELRVAGVADYGWERFSVNDGKVWREIQSGDTTGIFLFEGRVTIQQRESFQLASMVDLTNFLALLRLREGDQSLSQRFAAFQSERPDASEEGEGVASVLENTRGRVLYEEQLCDIICALAGKSPQDAWKMVHDLRSASPGILSTLRSQFMMGAAEKNVPMDPANRWFEKLLQYSKTTISHMRVFADALLVYKLFFLKTHHEASFYNALLNSNVENEGKLTKYVAPLRSRGMILGVDVNRSDVNFAVEDGKIRTGLCTVSGLDTEKAERIVKARAKGGFRSLEEFVRRVGTKHLTRDEVRALAEAGAFDSIGVGHVDLSRQVLALFGRRRSKSRLDRGDQLELPLDG